MTDEPRLCVVAGGAGSIGTAVSKNLASHGWKVIVIDQVDLEPNGAQEALRVNLGNLDEVKASLRHVKKKWGPISAVVNVAGRIASAGLFSFSSENQLTMTAEDFESVLLDNLRPAFNVSVAAAELFFLQRSEGVIVNFSSVVARGNAGQAPYAASKAAIESMSRSFAAELGRLNIRVISIAPGFVETESTKAALGASQLESVTTRTALRRMTAVDDVVKAVVFALENKSITGATIQVDGGFLLN